MQVIAAKPSFYARNRLSTIVQGTLLAIITVRSFLDLLLAGTRSNTGRLGTESNGSGAGAIINAIILAIGIITIFGSFQHHRARAVGLLWIPFLIITGVGVAHSHYPEGAIRTGLNIATYAAVFYCAYVFTDGATSLRMGLRAVLMSAVIPLLFPIIEVIRGGVVVDGAVRLQSTFPHPNIFSYYINVVICCGLFILFCVPQPHRVFGKYPVIALIGIGFVDLLATLSRAGLISAAVIIISFTALRARKLFLLVITAIMLSLLVPTIQDRLIGSLQSGNDYAGWETKLNSLAWRKLLWHDAVIDLGDDWLVGRGLDSFRDDSARFFPLAEGVPTDAHSVYIQFLYEIGALGLTSFLAIFAAIIFMVLNSTYRCATAKLIVIMMIVAHLICCYSDNIIYYLAYNWYFWFMAGLMTAAIHRGLVATPYPGDGMAPRSAYGTEALGVDHRLVESP